MKKIILFLLICSFQAIGQEKRINFGVMGGPTFSRIRFPFANHNSKIKTLFNAGGLIELKLTKSFIVQSKILYSLKGAQETNFGFVGNAGVRIAYLDLPLNINFKHKKMLVGIGPYFDVFLSGKNIIGNNNFYYVADIGEIQKTDKGYNLQFQYNLQKNQALVLNYSTSFKKKSDPFIQVLGLNFIQYL